MLAPVFRDADGVLRILLLLRTDVGRHGGQLGPARRAVPSRATATSSRPRCARPRRRWASGREQVEVLAALDPVETRATGWRVHPFLGLVPGDVEWRLQPDEVVRLLTPAVAMLGDPTRRRRLPFTSSQFPEPLEVEGIDVDGHVLWGMTLRLLDDLVPRLLAGEWAV